jgi:hypothetical protein
MPAEPPRRSMQSIHSFTGVMWMLPPRLTPLSLATRPPGIDERRPRFSSTTSRSVQSPWTACHDYSTLVTRHESQCATPDRRAAPRCGNWSGLGRSPRSARDGRAERRIVANASHARSGFKRSEETSTSPGRRVYDQHRGRHTSEDPHRRGSAGSSPGSGAGLGRGSTPRRRSRRFRDR